LPRDALARVVALHLAEAGADRLEEHHPTGWAEVPVEPEQKADGLSDLRLYEPSARQAAGGGHCRGHPWVAAKVNVSPQNWLPAAQPESPVLLCPALSMCPARKLRQEQ
jgi:hypothetical protein